MIAETIRSQVENTLRQLSHIPSPGVPIILAVSGGVDSMVMWDIFVQINTWPLLIYHLDHGLRAEATADIELIHQQAKKYGAAGGRIIAEKADVNALAQSWGCGFELAGRRFRYERLTALAQEYHAPVVMTGHHLNDQAETVLANVLRGAGPVGRAGIPPTRPLAQDIYLIRPLLSVSHDEIIKYAQQENILWLEDHTNADHTYRRNYLRHVVLPAYEQENPGITHALAGMATTAQNEVVALDRVTNAVWNQRTSHQLPISLVLPWTAEWRFHLWRRLAIQLGISIERTWLQRLDDLALGPIGKRLHAGQWMVMKRRDCLRWSLARPQHRDMRVTITGSGHFQRYDETLIIEEADLPSTLPASADDIYIDKAQVSLPCEWRLPEPIERFIPLGNPGSQTVRKHLANRDVPSELRLHVAVLADRDGIIWIPGYTIAHRVRITEQSTSVLHLRWSPSCAAT